MTVIAEKRKRFNVSGVCNPEIHYMVDVQKRLKDMKELVDRGEYFSVNRARQYGKTTTLKALSRFLRNEYIVIFLSFQSLTEEDFKDEKSFVTAFVSGFIKAVKNSKNSVKDLDRNCLAKLERDADTDPCGKICGMRILFDTLNELCAASSKRLVLIIDEVDSASNNQVFLDFLGQLRNAYLNRDETSTFWSVILAGVYDIKNLKQRLRPDDERRYNSPWNIAADFDIKMSFSVSEIAGMLISYEQDNETGMDVEFIAELIFGYTAGYPYLVSRICKLVDEKIGKRSQFSGKGAAWCGQGISEAVKELLKTPNTLFDDMIKKLEDYPELRIMLYEILFHGKAYPYNPYHYSIGIGVMFGFLKELDGIVVITNRIFEMHLYNLFLSEEVTRSEIYKAGLLDKNQFLENGILNMELILQKFVVHFSDIYDSKGERFIEETGRKLFLLYLKPIINGVGNYYVEARTRDLRRTDIVVDYRGQQFVIELKVWHGDEYNRRGEEQLAGYLEDYHLKKGYMLSFNFNKNKQAGIHKIAFGDKIIVEAVV